MLRSCPGPSNIILHRVASSTLKLAHSLASGYLLVKGMWMLRKVRCLTHKQVEQTWNALESSYTWQEQFSDSIHAICLNNKHCIWLVCKYFRYARLVQRDDTERDSV